MARRKKGRPVNGWLILDKGYDVGSTEAVSKARRLLDAQKAGPAGTLDPLATGILPIALGEATKTVPFVMDGRKRYRFTATWGERRATDDAEGEVIATSEHRPTTEEIEAALPRFVGEIEQTPPAFSAVKVAGERAYDLARDGEAPELESRIVDIHALRLVEADGADRAVFEAETGKGAYVRALVRDLAHVLGTEGYVSALRRTAVGPFTEEAAVKLADLEAIEDPAERAGLLAPVEAALSEAPQTPVDGGMALKLQRGQAIVVAPPQAKAIRGDLAGLVPAVLATNEGAPIAICELDGLKLKPTRVFNL